MFKRIIYDDWMSFIPIISFWLTFGVFIAITLRACLLKKETIHHMEQMPLQDDPEVTPERKNS
jgi:hypothetical protein